MIEIGSDAEFGLHPASAPGADLSSAAPADIARLVDELTDLQAIVEEHLLFEEASTVPVVRTWSSWPV